MSSMASEESQYKVRKLLCYPRTVYLELTLCTMFCALTIFTYSRGFLQVVDWSFSQYLQSHSHDTISGSNLVKGAVRQGRTLLLPR